jgi:hypothetical protein
VTTPSVERELAAHRLLHHYAASVDARDPDAVAALFAPGGTLVLRDLELTGPAIADFYRSRLTFPTLHFVTGITVAERPDGWLDVACGFFAIEMPAAGWSGVAGRYHDLVRVEAGSGAFVSRSITVDQRVALSPPPA